MSIEEIIEAKDDSFLIMFPCEECGSLELEFIPTEAGHPREVVARNICDNCIQSGVNPF